MLIELIDAEIAGLEGHRETLDLKMIELDRAEAGECALFDASKPACLARRYEADAERSYFKSLKEFRQVEAESLERAEAPPSLPEPPSKAEPRAQVGSFRETSEPVPSEPPMMTIKERLAATPLTLLPDGTPMIYQRNIQVSG